MTEFVSAEKQRAQMEESIKRMASQESIAKARKEGEEKHKELTTEQYHAIRRQAKSDLFFLCKGLLGYYRFTKNLHGHLGSWLSKTKHYQFRLVLLPRGHFKTTLVTMGGTIQTILPDVDKSAVYPASLGTDTRVLIGHETSLGAEKILFEITGHFLSNPSLMAFFPECIPTPRLHRVNTSELELPRSRAWGEPTVDTIGVGGRKQGTHYNLIKLDDLIGDKTRDSEVEMIKVKDWFDNIQSFFSYFPQDKFDLIGTRWSKKDLYQHAMDQYEDQMAVYKRPVWEVDPQSGEKVTIFPEEFTALRLKQLQKNRKVFTAQYLNNPEEGMGEWEGEWLRYYKWAVDGRVIVIGDPDRETRIRVGDLDIVFLVDPAPHTATGFIVTGVDRFNRIFILDAVKKAWQPKDFIDFTFQKVQRWWPRLVAVEDVIFSNLYKPYFEAEMRLRGIRFNVRLMPTKQKAKTYRVKGLASYFQAGQIYMLDTMTDLIEEFHQFGANNDDIHMLDALAYGPELWRQGKTKEDREHEQKAERALLDGRDPETGYSKL